MLFANTSLPVGGAETLLVNLVRSLDRERFEPEICCLKEPGPLGEVLGQEMPVHSRLLTSKYDLRVYGRLIRLLRQRQIDALVTVGAGDKMFWGRLAAWRTRTAGGARRLALDRLAGSDRRTEPSTDADHRSVHCRGPGPWSVPGRAGAVSGRESVCHSQRRGRGTLQSESSRASGRAP